MSRKGNCDTTQFILDEFDISYQPSGVYRLLHELNLSWITTRSKKANNTFTVNAFVIVNDGG
ncbi:winged helix-turn-helix domain-containing protein, partial [Vibrio splendidus]